MEIKIDGWKAHVCFSSAHLIPTHSKCSRLHGHTYAIHAVIKGDQDTTGMLVDFQGLKEALKGIAEELDHHVLLPQDMVTRSLAAQVHFTVQKKTYSLPKEDCVFLPIASVTAENLAQYILQQLLDRYRFPSTIQCVSIGVDEGVGQGAWVHQELQ